MSLFSCPPKGYYVQMKFKLVFSILKVHYVSASLHSLSHFIAANDSVWWIGVLETKSSKEDCYQMKRSQSANWWFWINLRVHTLGIASSNKQKKGSVTKTDTKLVSKKPDDKIFKAKSRRVCSLTTYFRIFFKDKYKNKVSVLQTGYCFGFCLVVGWQIQICSGRKL